MDRPSIFDGHLHAPFFIYFRATPKWTDEQVLAHFGLTTHRLTSKLQPSSTYAVIADACEWTLLADDWLYQLWHKPSTKAAIEALGQKCDVFAWSIGDCDESYDFHLYRSGRLVRQRIVDSPCFNDQIIRTDFGEILPSESELLSSDLPITEKMDRFTSSIGIDPIVTQDMLRVYSKPYYSKLDPNAGIRNL